MSDHPSPRESISGRNPSGSLCEEVKAAPPASNLPDTTTTAPFEKHQHPETSTASVCQHGFGSNAISSVNRKVRMSPSVSDSDPQALNKIMLGQSQSSPNQDSSMMHTKFSHSPGNAYVDLKRKVTSDSAGTPRLSRTPSKHKVNAASTANYNPSDDRDSSPSVSVHSHGFNVDLHAATDSAPEKVSYAAGRIGVDRAEHSTGAGVDSNSFIDPNAANQAPGLPHAALHAHESPPKTDHLPRRVLTFEPSPRGTSSSVSFSATSPPDSVAVNQANQNNTHALESTTPLKMSPLDGSHRTSGRRNSQHQLNSQPRQYPGVSGAPSDGNVQHSYSPHGQGHGQQGQGYGHGHGQQGQGHSQIHRYGHPPSQGQGHQTYPEYSHPQQPYSGQYGHPQQPQQQQSYPTQAPTANTNNHVSDYRPSPGQGAPPNQSYAPAYQYRDDHAQFSHSGHVNSGGKDDAISEFQPSPPPFDRIHMPFMELNSASHSESKHFEDLMASPALNLSFSRSGSAHRDRRTERRAPYDLHDQPTFNEHHNSPINIHHAPGSTPITKYCTPIVTGGNDRTRVTANTHSTSHSHQMEQNYRPSPLQGDNNDEYDYLHHYHRTFPTMRGGQPSPTRYDGSHPPSHPSHGPRSGPGALGSPMYATPGLPRGGPSDRGHHPASGHNVGHGPHSGPAKHDSHNKYIQPNAPSVHSSHHHGHGQHGHQMGGYYDPNKHNHGQHGYQPHQPHHHHSSYPPRQDGHYPPPPPPPPSYNMGVSPYGAPPPPPPPYNEYPPRYSQPHGNPYHSAHHPQNYNADVKKRKKTDTKRKAPKPAKRKKMYSDFVGVTYNKTHAKFQACITHYRKQHYLGRFKLACDAAKAYDQSARILKGEGWKINFYSASDYETARDKEFKIVEEKKLESGMDPATFHKSYTVSFPTDEALRVKLGMGVGPGRTIADNTNIAKNTQVSRPNHLPVKTESIPHMSDSRYPAHPPHGQYQGPSSMMQQQQHQQYGPLAPAPSTVPHQHPASGLSNAGSSGLAVTPSPNVNQNNVAKNSTTLMNEALMSPGFASGSSPSALSILGGTPFSMPGSIMRSTAKSSTMDPTEGGTSQRDLDTVSTNIFQSPHEKMPSTMIASVSAIKPSTMTYSTSGIKENVNDDEESDKGKGDLTAASALLMMNNN